jgi:DNA-binding NtrC family response regulator
MSLVLIVDDQSGIRELLISWIGREGYQTAQAADAETALDEMIARPADVVFCDIQMPGQGGFWLADRLRERFPETAIILATGNGNIPPAVSMQNGVVEYLLKPFNREAVLKAVRHGLEWHQMSRAVRARTNDRTGSIEKWLGAPARNEKV